MEKEVAKKTVEQYKGKTFGEYKNTYEYVIYGGWERDYFGSWFESCNPSLEEIAAFCKETDEVIRLYIEAVEEE